MQKQRNKNFIENLNLIITLFKVCPLTYLYQILLILSLLSVFFEIIGISSLFLFLSFIINGEEFNFFGSQLLILTKISNFFQISTLLILLGLLFLSFFTSFIFKFLFSIIQTKFCFLVAEEIANLSFQSTIDSSITKIEKNHSSDIISMIISKTNICVTHILFPIVSALAAFSTVFFISIFLLYVNFKVTLLFILIVLLIYLLIIKFSEKKNI